MNGLRRARLRAMLLYSLFVLGFLLLFTQIKSAANLCDEGLVLTNAERIRAGEVPYRDFWTMYGPGYFYALAGLFSLVEPTILVARLFDTALRFLLTLEVYLLARTVTSRRVALLPYAFVTFWLATIRFYSYPAFPCDRHAPVGRSGPHGLSTGRAQPVALPVGDGVGLDRTPPAGLRRLWGLWFWPGLGLV